MSNKSKRRAMRMQDPSEQTTYLDLGGLCLSSTLASKAWILVYIPGHIGRTAYYARGAKAPVAYLQWVTLFDSEQEAERTRLRFKGEADSFLAVNLLEHAEAVSQGRGGDSVRKGVVNRDAFKGMEGEDGEEG